MLERYEDPTYGPVDRLGHTAVSHPSYATINISRVSGRKELFDSSFTHHNYITLSIRSADRIVDGPTESIYSKEEYIEVAMSESQFARAITALNMGSGAPCTLVRRNGKGIPQARPESVVGNHTEMVRDKLKGAFERQKATAAKIRKWREEKHRPTLAEMDQMVQDMEGQAANFHKNMDYFAGCFEEHMETVVDAAKTEIEAHVLATADKLGFRQDEMPRLEVHEGGSD